jgi:hypothetical protein
MFKQKLLLSTIGAALLLTAGTSIATTSLSADQVIAREASEGPRGGDNERPGDRQRRGGRNGAIDNPADGFVVAREASEGPRGGDNEAPGDRQRRNRGGRNA